MTKWMNRRFVKLLNGKEPSQTIKDEVKKEVERIKDSGHNIYLAVIQVGDNSASNVYIKNKIKTCDYCGIKHEHYKFSEDAEEEDVIRLIECLNNDNAVTGILVQLPLPKHIDEKKVIHSIRYDKDVDGLTELNMGRLTIGEDAIAPCTAEGIVELLKYYNIKIEGMNCVVVGRSNIVGKPTALLLSHSNGTVTICHSKTQGLNKICKEADILVCAIGKPKFFNKEFISQNTAVIDVGIHRQVDGKLCGDVDFDDVKDIVSAITPVPGGVGLMTTSMLMKNCLKAYKLQERK